MSTLKANRVEQVSNSKLPVNLLPVTAAAWVNFNGTGTPTIRDSHNVETITDLGVGQYRVNFSNPLDSGNYSAQLCGSFQEAVIPTSGYLATSVEVQTKATSGTAIDPVTVGVTVFGGQS